MHQEEYQVTKKNTGKLEPNQEPMYSGSTNNVKDRTTVNRVLTPNIIVTATPKVTTKDPGVASDLNLPQKVGHIAAENVQAHRILYTCGGKII